MLLGRRQASKSQPKRGARESAFDIPGYMVDGELLCVRKYISLNEIRQPKGCNDCATRVLRRTEFRLLLRPLFEARPTQQEGLCACRAAFGACAAGEYIPGMAGWTSLRAPRIRGRVTLPVLVRRCHNCEDLGCATSSPPSAMSPLGRDCRYQALACALSHSTNPGPYTLGHTRTPWRHAQVLSLATRTRHPHVCGAGDELQWNVNMFTRDPLPSVRPGESGLYSVVPEL